MKPKPKPERVWVVVSPTGRIVSTYKPSQRGMEFHGRAWTSRGGAIFGFCGQWQWETFAAQGYRVRRATLTLDAMAAGQAPQARCA